VGLNSLKSLNLTNVYPNNKKNNNKVKSKSLKLYELAGKNSKIISQGNAGFRFENPNCGSIHVFSVGKKHFT
jgi:hypothetical protein